MVRHVGELGPCVVKHKQGVAGGLLEKSLRTPLTFSAMLL
jgi:hypothetical protein